jgi:hypothetical protein
MRKNFASLQHKKFAQQRRQRTQKYVVQYDKHGNKIKHEEDEYEIVNLFEVLEDRYYYEGCNRCVFMTIYAFLILLIGFASIRGVDIAMTKSNIIAGLVPPETTLSRNGFAAWTVLTSRTLAQNPKYSVDDNLILLRMEAIVSPARCNYTYDHPVTPPGKDITKSTSSSYEVNVCKNKLAGDEKNVDSQIFQYKKIFNLHAYSILHSKDMRFEKDNYYGSVFVPLWSAELHEQNISSVTQKQINNYEKLVVNNPSVQVAGLVTQFLDPYKHLVYHVENKMDWRKTSAKRDAFITISPMPTLPQGNNALFIFLIVLMVCCAMAFTYSESMDIQDTLKKMKMKRAIENDNRAEAKTDMKQMMEDFLNHFMLDSLNLLDLVVMVCQWMAILSLCVINFFTVHPTNFPNKHAEGSIRRIEDVTTVENYFTQVGLYPEIINGNSWVISACAFFVTLAIFKEMSWHAGASVFVNTVKYAIMDLADVLVVTFIMLCGFAYTTFFLFGVGSGSYDFGYFSISAISVARMAFGMYDYDLFINDGYGAKYNGLGMADYVANFRIVIVWVAFILLTIIISNIFIAVIFGGFEKHKDEQMDRQGKQVSLIHYAFLRVKHHLSALLICFKHKSNDFLRLKFAATPAADLLLQICVSPRDNIVFEDILQEAVVKDIVERYKNVSDIDHIDHKNEKTKKKFINDIKKRMNDAPMLSMDFQKKMSIPPPPKSTASSISSSKNSSVKEGGEKESIDEFTLEETRSFLSEIRTENELAVILQTILKIAVETMYIDSSTAKTVNVPKLAEKIFYMYKEPYEGNLFHENLDEKLEKIGNKIILMDQKIETLVARQQQEKNDSQDTMMNTIARLEGEILFMNEKQNETEKKLEQMIVMMDGMNSLMHLKYFGVDPPTKKPEMVETLDDEIN